jgi:hypothetical protein
MSTVDAPRLSVEVAKAKAAECRELAMRARKREQQIMLYHIAETWERIAQTVTAVETGRE